MSVEGISELQSTSPSVGKGFLLLGKRGQNEAQLFLPYFQPCSFSYTQAVIPDSCEVLQLLWVLKFMPCFKIKVNTQLLLKNKNVSNLDSQRYFWNFQFCLWEREGMTASPKKNTGSHKKRYNSPDPLGALARSDDGHEMGLLRSQGKVINTHPRALTFWALDPHGAAGHDCSRGGTGAAPHSGLAKPWEDPGAAPRNERGKKSNSSGQPGYRLLLS